MAENRPSLAPPTVRPGEIWLVEHEQTEIFSALDREAVGAANVVLYDRVLESLIAEILPLGTYAEPLPAGDRGGGAAVSSRALRFAEEGWRVVQVVAARSGWRERVEDAIDGLAMARQAGELPVVVIVKAASGSERRSAGCVSRLHSVIEEVADDDPLTLIFGPLAAADPSPGQAFTANGLAG